MSVSEITPLLGNSGIHRPGTEPKSPTGKGDFSFSSVGRRKKFIFISMAFVNFCATCCFSLLAPFFPIEAGKKGVSQTIVGMIFGAFELVIVISSPIFGNYISKIGCKFMYVTGIMVCGTCAILFGTLDMCPDGTIFIVMCFLCRSVEALGCSALVTALFAILAHEFPDHVITVMGTLETFSGLGMMVGPPIGGALYELGGYGLPFFAIGSVVIVCGLVTSYAMPPISAGRSKMYKGSILHLLRSFLVVVSFLNVAMCSMALGFMDVSLAIHFTEGQKMYEGSIFTMIKSPFVLLTFLNISAGSIALGFMDPTLANHLNQFNLKTWVIGLMFLIAPGIYAFTAPIWGYIGDKKGYIRLMIGLGNLAAVFSWLVLGPAPFLTFIPNKLYINVISLAVMGLGIGCSLIPTFKALLIGANSLGMENNLDTYGKCSGFFNSSFSLGAFLGPTIGGYLVDKFGFPWASSGIAWLLCLAGILMLIYTCCVPNLPKLPEDSLNIEKTVPSESLTVSTSAPNGAAINVEAAQETNIGKNALENIQV